MIRHSDLGPKSCILSIKAMCRHLGYWDGVALKRSFYGGGNGTVWLSRIHCTGEETSLLQCPHEGLNASFSVSKNRACGNHTDDASVFCYTNRELIVL